MKKTVVIGASPDSSRYSNMAVKLLKEYGYEVVPIGSRRGEIAGIAIETGLPETVDTDTVSLYLNPERQKAIYDYIIGLHPKRIIFNPGTENPELESIAIQNGIEAIEACTLVMLRTGQFWYPMFEQPQQE